MDNRYVIRRNFWIGILGFFIISLGIWGCNQNSSNPDTSITSEEKFEILPPDSLLIQAKLLIDSSLFKEAIPVYRQALSLFHIDTSRPDTLKSTKILEAYNGIAHCLARTGELEIAKSILEDTVIKNGFKLIPENHKEIGKSYFILGVCLIQLGEIPRAINTFATALNTFTKDIEGNKRYIIQALTYNGYSDLQNGKVDEAITVLDSAIQFAYAHGENKCEELATTYRYLSMAYKSSYKYQPALDSLKKGAEIFGLYPNRSKDKIGDIYLTIGDIYRKLDAVDSVLYYYQKTQENWEKYLEPDDDAFVILKNNQSLLYGDIGNQPERLKVLLEAKKILQKKFTPNSNPLSLVVHNNIANTYNRMGEPILARDYHQQIASTYLRKSDSVRYGISIMNIGLTYYGQQNYHESIKFYEDALQILVKKLSPFHPRILSLKYNIGTAYHKINHYKEAILYLDQVLQARIFKTGLNSGSVADAMTNLGMVYLDRGNFDKAEELCLRAKKILFKKFGKNHSRAGRHTRNLAKVYGSRKDFQKSLDLIEPYTPDISKYQDSSILFIEPTDFDQLSIRAEIIYHLYLNNPISDSTLKESKRTYLRALNLLSRMRKDIKKVESKSEFHDRYFKTFNGTIKTLHLLFQSTNEQIYIEEALKVYNQYKAILLSDNLRDDIARETFLSINSREKLSSIEREILILSRKKKEKEQLLDLVAQRESLIEELEKENSKYAQLKYQKYSPSLDSIKSFLSSNKQELLEFFWGDTAIYVLRIGAKHQDFYSISIDNDLKENLDRVIQFVHAKNEKTNATFATFARASNQLYNSLFPRVSSREFVGKNTLIIIPDGMLTQLPFEVLITENESESNGRTAKYLIKKQAIHYENAFHFLMTNENSIVSSNLLAGFAPSYLLYEDNGISTSDSSSISFHPLLQNKSEVESINGLIKGSKVIGSKATKKTFIEKSGDYGYLHLATHAFVDEQNPMHSGVVFEPSKNAQDSLDTDENILKAYEIYGLSLQSDLVFLSSCNSGSGKLLRGEGVLSLAHAFKFAGSRNVVSSLWSVNDQYASQIPILFYDYLKQGLGKADALREAKLHLLRTTESVDVLHPYYWSGFVLVGDNNPIQSFHKLWYNVLIVILTLAMLAGGIFFIKRRRGI